MNLKELPSLQYFSQDYQEANLHIAANNLLERMGVHLDITGEVPRNDPVLVISNHPGVDAIILSAAINRVDFSFVGLAVYQEILPDLAGHILPIFLKQRLRDNVLPLLQVKSTHTSNDTAQIRAWNKESISTAAMRVNQGECVAIFPTGSAGSSASREDWKDGVGHLVSQISNQETKIVFANITSKKIDYLRLLPWPYNILFKQTENSVVFSDPMDVSTIVDNENHPKQIRHDLQAKYFELFS